MKHESIVQMALRALHLMLVVAFVLILRLSVFVANIKAFAYISHYMLQSSGPGIRCALSLVYSSYIKCLIVDIRSIDFYGSFSELLLDQGFECPIKNSTINVSWLLVNEEMGFIKHSLWLINQKYPFWSTIKFIDRIRAINKYFCFLLDIETISDLLPWNNL